MKSDEQLWQICLDIYRELFKLATPSLDFNTVIVSGVTLKSNWFMAYYLDEERQRIVIEKHIKENRLSDYEAKKIRNEICLGCSPSYDKRVTEFVRGNT